MTKMVQAVATIVKELKPSERAALFDELLASGMLTEDQQDLLTIESRRGGKSKPLSRVITNLKAKGKMK